MQVERVGFNAVYLSGGGVAYASNGYPDLGITDMHDVLEEARKITGCVDIPLLADIDVGWGGAFNISRTIKEMNRAGVAAVHMEDQIAQKRCGHRPNKELVTKEEMGDRIKAAVDGKIDPDFVLMARCDAYANEGLEPMIERMVHYVECGADMLFAEAMDDLTHYQKIKDATGVPLLANITEFGKTDLYTTQELAAHGVDMALYPSPLSAPKQRPPKPCLRRCAKRAAKNRFWISCKPAPSFMRPSTMPPTRKSSINCSGSR